MIQVLFLTDSTPTTTTVQTRQVQSDDGTTVNISAIGTNQQIDKYNIKQDVGFGPGTDDTTTTQPL